MNGWIENCRRSHQPVCMMPQQVGGPKQQVGGPKRLLQCLPDGSVKLVDTQSLPQPCYYIALSYCWGDPEAMKKTTMETLERHQIGIPDEDLQPLHREAVALARRLKFDGLKIGYIWIDALCIVQDSEEDKDREEEIMQMNAIFAGALVVVVAALAKPKSSLDSLMRVKRLKPPSDDQSHIWRDASLIRYKEMDFNVKFRKRTWTAHWSTDATFDTQTGARAWCFQEKLLASCCLVFRDDEVVWQCRSCCQCECGGEQEHFSVGYEPGFTMAPYQKKRLLPSAEQDSFQVDGTLTASASNEAAYEFWKDAVEDYSHRALSLKTDRLPAISAVASIVAKATGDRYLAGLWRNDLIAGLGWIPSVWSSGLGLHRHQEYIAPTWSWASLLARVWYEYPRSNWRCDADLDASVLDAWATLESQNLYGPVSDAAIVLSGHQCDAELKIPELGFDAQLDFRHDDVQTVGLGPYFNALDFMRVVPDENVDRYMRRAVPGRQAHRQAACSGTVRLLWLKEHICLILTPSQEKKGASGETAYERLGILYPETYEHQRNTGIIKTRGIINPPKMPKTAQRSSITLV